MISGKRSSGQAGYRLARLWAAADVRKVPLRTIIAAIVAVAIFYLAGKLIYRLRDVILLILVAGFLALILNPVVAVIEQRVVKRRGWAVTIVAVLMTQVDPRGNQAPQRTDPDFRDLLFASVERIDPPPAHDVALGSAAAR